MSINYFFTIVVYYYIISVCHSELEERHDYDTASANSYTVLAVLQNAELPITLTSGLPMRLSIAPLTTGIKLELRNDTRNVTQEGSPGFVIFQVHSQVHALTLSLTPQYEYESSVNTTAAGVVYVYKILSEHPTAYLNNTHNTSVQVLIIATSYTDRDPIPGGCSLEFAQEQAPYCKLHEHYSIAATLNFQFAQQISARGSPVSCETSYQLNSVEYDVYMYFLKHNDFSEDEYFASIEKLLTVNSIQETARKVHTLDSKEKTSVGFGLYRGQGAMYAVIARDRETLRAVPYVPIGGYGCKLSEPAHTCDGYNVIVIAVLLAVIGGMLWLLLWVWLCIPVVSILLTGLVLGYVCSSLLFFVAFGGLDFFRNGLNYAMVFLSIVLLVPCLLLPFSNLVSLVSTAVVGSYAFVVAIDQFTRGSMTYVVLNSVRHGYSEFSEAFVLVPFQTNEVVLTVVWMVLAVLGIALQLRRERQRAPFPPPPSLTWMQYVRRPGSSIAIDDSSSETSQDDDREPLIQARLPVLMYGATLDAVTGDRPHHVDRRQTL
ncbi:PREDICTED: transmembrane 7 superfamily member 3-like [Priapulus caudatus]|uniref:Transmembrane 7 superfamily member 3-like n=1 Tax=Priapulus caudatus TaxID=37621 RepID=A0ABM1ETK5_PRICU|nr:PREDICTED: transmembrane 7 superfamily member 3-like [Priapulus caudatus]